MKIVQADFVKLNEDLSISKNESIPDDLIGRYQNTTWDNLSYSNYVAFLTYYINTRKWE